MTTTAFWLKWARRRAVFVRLTELDAVSRGKADAEVGTRPRRRRAGVR